MQRDHGGGAAREGDIRFRTGASVERELGAEEHFGVELGWIGRIGNGRVAGKDHHGFAFDVHAFVVVPLVFRRDDAIAGEDDGRIGDVDGGLGLRRSDAVILGGERKIGIVRFDGDFAAAAGDAPERDGLQPAAIGIAGREFQRLALGDDVVEAFSFTRRGRTAALEFVGGKNADVFEDSLGRNRVEGAGRNGRGIGARQDDASHDGA